MSCGVSLGSRVLVEQTYSSRHTAAMEENNGFRLCHNDRGDLLDVDLVVGEVAGGGVDVVSSDEERAPLGKGLVGLATRRDGIDACAVG